MAKRYGLSLILAILCALFAAAAANAQWVKNGVPVGSSNGTQFQPRIIPDGANGAMVVWADDRAGAGWDIYGNRVTADGIVLGGSGVPLCSANGDQYVFGGIFDPNGYAIVVWMDYRDGDQKVYAQLIDTMGNMYWPTDGMNICSYANYPSDPSIIPDGAGGAIIAWNDSRNGGNDIFAQRIDADGTLLWGDEGLSVCVDASDQYAPKMVPDGAGGAIIVWTDYRNGDIDIFGQRIDGDGNLLWNGDGVSVCSMGNGQYNPKIAAASFGGAYVLWTDQRNGYDDVYVQWIDSYGSPVWALDGIPVCDDAGSWIYKYTPALVEDGSGGVIVAWGDTRNEMAYSIYGQRFDSDGTMAWGSYGKLILPCYEYTGDIEIKSDGSGGAIAVASVYRDDISPTDIYAQRVDNDGALLWGSGGTVVCAASEYQYTPVLIGDGMGGVIVAWEDQRTETEGSSDIYCQRLGASGLWGNPAPEIVSCLDVPEDQGGWVRIRTRASALDKAGEESAILGYNAWRLIAGGGGPLAASAAPAAPASDRAKLVALLSDGATAKGIRVSAAQAASLGLPEGDWESVGFWFATRDTVYNIAVPTKNDSTEAGTAEETYIVTAHTSMAGVFVASEPATGYSIDNIAPGVTPELAGNEIASPPGLMLSWAANPASDIWKYNVYRGDNDLFVPDEASFLGSTTDRELHDGTWVYAYQYFYKLVAVDRHGNMGPAALLRPEDVKVGTMLASFAASLAGSAAEISWKLSEIDENAAFHVFRAIAGGRFAELSSARIVREGASYAFKDETLEPGTTYRYRVNVVEGAASRTLFETEAITTPAMPLTLHQNHPNPFNPSTTIGYYLPVDAPVTLDVYDSSGRLVARLLNGAKQSRGTHSVEWRGLDAQGRTASSGVYFYRLTSGKETISRKMILLR